PAGGADVADPLGLAAGCDQVLPAVDRQEVDRSLARLAALAAPHLQHPASPHADAGAGQHLNDLVEDVAGEPAGRAVVGRRSWGACLLGHCFHLFIRGVGRVWLTLLVPILLTVLAAVKPDAGPRGRGTSPLLRVEPGRVTVVQDVFVD